MDAESYGKDAVKTVYYNHAYSGSKLLKLKVTPPSLLPSSSVALASCLSSPPFLILRDLSLLFEAAGRTVNPVNGAVGLLSTGNWHICQVAVETVLRGGALRPLTDLESSSSECTDIFKLRDSGSTSRLRVEKRRRPYEPEMKQLPDPTLNLSQALPAKIISEKRRSETPSRISEESVTTSCYESGTGLREVKLLNLF